MSNIAKKILEKIEKEKIKIIPKWRFILFRGFVWTALVIAMLLSAVAVSMVMLQICDIDWDLIPRMVAKPPFEFFRLVPYFWLIIAAVLFVFAYFDFRKTRKGYKYGGEVVVIFSILLSLIGGTVMYFVHAPHMTDEFLSDMPFFREMDEGRQGFWHDPEGGMISGAVISVKDGVLIIQDPGRHEWNVDVLNAEMNGTVYPADSRKAPPCVFVRVMGNSVDGSHFVAREIRCKRDF